MMLACNCYLGRFLRCSVYPLQFGFHCTSTHLALCLLALVFAPFGALGQVPISDDRVIDHLMAVEEQFQDLRKHCCVLMVEERNVDNPDAARPVTVRLEYIFANHAERSTRRHDVGYAGDILEAINPKGYTWNRTLTRPNRPELRFQGNFYQGSEDNTKPLFFKLVDPFALTTTAIVGVLTGDANDTWFSRVILDKEILKAEVTREGDIVAHIVTAKDRTMGATIRLSKKFNFLPTLCVYFRNAAEDPARDFKPGFVYSQVRTTWTLNKKTKQYLPTFVVVDGPRWKPEDIAHQSEFRYYWMDLDKVSDLLFDEVMMRDRWETGESILAAALDANGALQEKHE